MKFGEITLGGRFGGWKIINQPANKLPQPVASGLYEATSADDYVYTPIWYFGEQLVNGMNHLLICERIRDEESHIVIVIFNIPPNSVGGKGAKLVDVVQHADLYGALKVTFEEKLGNLCGVSYKPVGYLGEKVVKGINHYVLAEALLQYPGARPYPVVIEFNIFGSDANVTAIGSLENMLTA